LTNSSSLVDGPANLETYSPRFYTRIPTQKFTDLRAPLSDSRKIAIVNLICRSDDATAVLDLLRQYPPDNPSQADYDILLDEQGHTALHLAASMARVETVEALVNAGADVNRGNYNGETPLIRSCLATAAFEHHSFHVIVLHLNKSVRTLDSSKKSVLHHIVSTAGIKARAVAARYYLDQVFYWIARHQGGDFRSLINLQDENGDTALNISARVGNRSLVRTLLDVGANKILPNKLGLRPGDFGVETEVIIYVKNELSVHQRSLSLPWYLSTGTLWWSTSRGPAGYPSFCPPSARAKEQRNYSGHDDDDTEP
jgi:regulatory protein SWI6